MSDGDMVLLFFGWWAAVLLLLVVGGFIADLGVSGDEREKDR